MTESPARAGLSRLASEIVNRKWMVVAGLAAILALVIGAAVGRNIISSPTPSRPEPKRFEDSVADVSLSYPANWTRLESADPEVRLLAAADQSTSLLVRIQKVGLAPVTVRTLPVVKPLTDQVLAEGVRARQLTAAAAIELGGLPGWRYRYTYPEKDGVVSGRIHYFLFKNGRIIQLVFQAMPSTRLDTLTPTFDRIAGTFEGSRR